MLTFSQFLKEAGDAALPFRYHGERDEYGQRYHLYSFENNGRKYRVRFAHHDMPHPVAIVNFDDNTDYHLGDLNLTGHAKHAAVKVMSTVHNIVKHHISKHPDIEEVRFTSSHEEPSRVKLYTKYAEKHRGITDPTDYDVIHVVPAHIYRLAERFIIEAGNAPVNFIQYHQSGKHSHNYLFHHGGYGYRVSIIHDTPERNALVAFSSSRGEYNPRAASIHTTGDVGSGATKIMSTIHHIVRHHVNEHPSIERVSFSSDPDEVSRSRLYAKYTNKHGGSVEHTYGNDKYIIPAQSYRSSINESEDQPIRIRLGQAKGEQAKKFLDDFVADSDEHPFNPAARILHGSVVHASRDGNQVHIHDIHTLAPKSGAGTKALKHLTSLADKHNIKLNIFAKAYSSRPEHIRSTPKLIKWYEKHGFKHDEPDYDPDYGSEMTYYPK